MRIPKYPLLVLLFTLFYYLIAHFPLYDYGSLDYWGWASHIRKLSNMPLDHPSLHFFSTVHPLGPVPYNYNPHAWALGLIKKISHLNSFTLLNTAGLVNFILFAIGLHLFLKEYFFDPELSFLMLPIMLFFGGKSWDYSGAYDIGAQVLNLFNGYAFAFSLSFFALFFFIKFLKTERIKFLLLLSVFLPTILLNNLEPGVFTLGTMGLLFLLERKRTLKTFLSLFVLALLTIILAAGWPYYSFLRLLKDGFLIHSLFDPTYYFSSDHLWRLGPVLFGIPFIFYYAFKKRYPLVVFGFCAFSLSYPLAFFLKIPTGWRLLFFITFFLHLSIALYLREKLPFLSRTFILSKKNGATVLLVSVAFACVLYQTVSLTAKELGFHSFQETLSFVQNNKGRGLGLEKQFQFLSQYVPSEGIVLADRETSRIVPAFSGWPVLYLEGDSLYDPLIEGLEERQEEIRNFFGPETSSEERIKTIKKHKANYVLWNVDRVGTPFPEDLKKSGKVLYQKDYLTLVEIPFNQ